MSEKVLKILGLVATAVGVGATMLGNYVNDRKMEATVNEKVNEALSKRNEEES